MLHGEVTDRILHCLIAVHRELGPGLSENSYQAAVALEFAARKVGFVREPTLSVTYRGVEVGCHRPDFIVEDRVVLELKATTTLTPVFVSQVLTYLHVSKLHVALLVNFNVAVLKDGVKRIVL
jgi:GxxExxY protein